MGVKVFGKLMHDTQVHESKVIYNLEGLSKEKKLSLLLDWAEELIHIANELEDREVAHHITTLYT